MPFTNDVAAHVRLVSAATRSSKDEDWETAARRWQQVVVENPVNGDHWMRLGEARDRSGDRAGAIDAYRQAFDLGAGNPFPADTAYQIARNYTLLNDQRQALEWLQRAIALGFRHLDRARDDDDLQTLRGNPTFRELVGLREPGEGERADRWRRDLQFLTQEVWRRGPNVPRRISRDDWNEATTQLDRQIPTLSDQQIIIELMKLVTRLGDGHSEVYGVRDDPDARKSVPLIYYLFEEGLYIIGVAPEHRDLLGSRVTHFDDRPVDDLLTGLLPIISRDNEYWPKGIAPARLRVLPILHTLGLIDSSDRVRIRVEADDGVVRSVTVEADSSWDNARARGSIIGPDDWLFLPRALGTPVPLYLEHMEAAYWYTVLPQQQAVYFQFNRVRDEVEDFRDFSSRLFQVIDDQEVDKLIIDVRWNNGGNTFLEMPFLHRLIGCRKVNRRGALYVIIGRKTFSAAQNFVTMIDRHTEAIFVGEPTGSSPNFVGETVPFELPYSQVAVNVSDLYWQSSWPMDQRTWIAPDIYVPPTFAAFNRNRDPALEAILDLTQHLPAW